MAELTKIGPAHLRREAWVYVRQSTMTQVRENTESLKRQYELVERAHRLGWPADRVRVIDDDLGCSGAEATARVGFQGLVAAVGLGQVGCGRGGGWRLTQGRVLVDLPANVADTHQHFVARAALVAVVGDRSADRHAQQQQRQRQVPIILGPHDHR